jgi:hypothetical protein
LSQSPLTIYLLPVGDGDSIVLRFPNGDWGLIDWIKVSHHGARNANPKWLWAWLSHRRQKNRPLHAVISAEGNAFHPHPNVLAEIHRHASVETTYTDSFALQSTIPSASATWAQRATPDFVTEQKTPAETWHTHLHRGRLCHYEVFADGHIRVPHHQGAD